MDIDMKVIGKALKGKRETPTVTLKSDKGEQLTFQPANLEDYDIEDIITVKVERVQQTLEQRGE